MRLATQFDRIHRGGAETIAISVDNEVRQAAMARRWGLGSMRFVADPGGTTFLEPLGLFDPDERDGIALPALVLIDSEANEQFRHLSRDFADRTGDDDVLERLEELELTAIDAPTWTYDAQVPEDLGGYFPTNNLWPYLRGNFFGARAARSRIKDPVASEVLSEHEAMAKSMSDAVAEWKINFGD